MKLLFITGSVIIMFFASFLKTASTIEPLDAEARTKALLKKRSSSITCSPDWATYYLSKQEILQMIPLPGTGSHFWKISTKNDSAQFYFNQGINFYYGFHIIEAMPSFKKAQTFDSGCAMLYWGEALAYGPNINDIAYTASANALTASIKAKEFMHNASVKEKYLIVAMQTHYSNDSTKKREFLNQQYADEMKALFIKYPTDAEIGTLYADALMNQHPWDLWQHDGKPKQWTPGIRKVLEQVLKYSPDHPGANHYYIHTMEASPFAINANASADRLAKLTPGMAHMVHMPSHIYIRTGQYDKGIQSNISGVKSYQSYLQLYPDVANNAFLYEIHNRHMQAACSINKNDYPLALKDAIDCRISLDTSFLSLEAPMGPYIQYIYMTPELTMINFEKWNEITDQPEVSTRFHYVALIGQFAKGMAYANTGKMLMAQASLKQIETLLQEKDLSIVLAPFNAPVAAGKVAKYILMGTIARNENNIPAAINYFKTAVATQDSLIYNEPRDWLISARQYLGNALLDTKKYREAEEVFRKDLKVQPGNYIALKGFKLAIRNQKK
ncbi:MAG: hypothetical protein ABIO81_03110 [Ginsengibacter sp.]